MVLGGQSHFHVKPNLCLVVIALGFWQNETKHSFYLSIVKRCTFTAFIVLGLMVYLRVIGCTSRQELSLSHNLPTIQLIFLYQLYPQFFLFFQDTCHIYNDNGKQIKTPNLTYCQAQPKAKPQLGWV